MLGIETRREPIRGEFAKRIREQLRRAHSVRQEDTSEQQVTSTSAADNKYHAVW